MLVIVILLCNQYQKDVILFYSETTLRKITPNGSQTRI
jgi:hypothetical protein